MGTDSESVPDLLLLVADGDSFLLDRCLQLFHRANAWAMSSKYFHRLQTMFDQGTSKGLGR